MKWKILCYGMKNKNNRHYHRRILAGMCIAFSRWDGKRTEKKLGRTAIRLSNPKYSAREILQTAAQIDVKSGVPYKS